MPAANETVTADFEAIPYTVTSYTDETRGSVTADTATATAGQTVTLTVVENEGYKLDVDSLKVTYGDEGVIVPSGSGPYIFTMPGEDVTVEAALEAKTEVEIGLKLGADGILVSDEPVTISKSGADNTFTAQVKDDNDYSDITWYLGAAKIDGPASITINAASYNPGKYELRVLATKDSVLYSASIAFTVTE